MTMSEPAASAVRFVDWLLSDDHDEPGFVDMRTVALVLHNTAFAAGNMAVRPCELPRMSFADLARLMDLQAADRCEDPAQPAALN